MAHRFRVTIHPQSIGRSVTHKGWMRYPKVAKRAYAPSYYVSFGNLLLTGSDMDKISQMKMVPVTLVNPTGLSLYNSFRLGRDAAFERANQRACNILQDSLRQYHTMIIGPYGRSIQSIRAKFIPGKEGTGLLNHSIMVGYQPTPSEDTDTETDRGVTTFMLTAIKGVAPNKIHPPWRGKWAEKKSDVGAIYGSKEYAGFPGGRLGYFAFTKGIIPSDPKYITKQQKNPRGSKYEEIVGAVGRGNVTETRFAKSKYYGKAKKPGPIKGIKSVTENTYVPRRKLITDETGAIMYEAIEGGFEKEKVYRNSSWVKEYVNKENERRLNSSVNSLTKQREQQQTNKFARSGTGFGSGRYSYELYDTGWRHRSVKLGQLSDEFKSKLVGDEEKGTKGVGINDKTWEMAAKLISASIEKRGIKPKPVLSIWWDNEIESGNISQLITTEYMDVISNWYNKAKRHAISQNKELSRITGKRGPYQEW